jgi:hypothetical protein
MRLLEPFEFPLEKVEPLHIGDNRRLSRFVRRFEIGGIQREAHAMTGDQFVHPGEVVEVVPIKRARFRRADCAKMTTTETRAITSLRSAAFFIIAVTSAQAANHLPEPSPPPRAGQLIGQQRQ